jgi:hypothetical protein
MAKATSTRCERRLRKEGRGREDGADWKEKGMDPIEDFCCWIRFDLSLGIAAGEAG